MVFNNRQVFGLNRTSTLVSNSDFSLTKINWSGKWKIKRGNETLLVLSDSGSFNFDDSGLKLENQENSNDLEFVLSSDSGNIFSIVKKIDNIPISIKSFTPAVLFANNEAGAWYDPSDLSTLYQDSAGTTAVTAPGDPVGRMADKSGNGNHATQSTDSARPVLRQDANGKYYLDFDGTDDHLILGSFALPADHWLALAYDTLGDDSEIYWSDTNKIDKWIAIHEQGSTNTNLQHIQIGGAFQSLYVDGVQQSISTRDDAHVAVSGKHVQVWYNTTFSPTPTNSWNIGTMSLSAFNMAGRLYGYFWRDRMTSDERANLESYLANRAGVTLP